MRSKTEPKAAYISYMEQRLLEMRRILKPNGSIYLHCDPKASQHLKAVVDRIFGTNSATVTMFV